MQDGHIAAGSQQSEQSHHRQPEPSDVRAIKSWLIILTSIRETSTRFCNMPLCWRRMRRSNWHGEISRRYAAAAIPGASARAQGDDGVQGNLSGHRWALCSMVIICTTPPFTRYGTIYGVRGMTSSRVPGTRPGRPRPGDAAKRVTAARIRSIMRSAAVGFSAAMRSRISSSRRK